jgi:hypothetical protein
MRSQLSISILLLIFLQAGEALRVLDPSEIRNQTAATPEFYCLPEKLYLEGMSLSKYVA